MSHHFRAHSLPDPHFIAYVQGYRMGIVGIYSCAIVGAKRENIRLDLFNVYKLRTVPRMMYLMVS